MAKKRKLDVDIKQLTTELASLRARARRVGYKDIQPKLPESLTHSTMMGFNKRLHNWKSKLEHMEHQHYAEEAVVEKNDTLLKQYPRN